MTSTERILLAQDLGPSGFLFTAGGLIVTNLYPVICYTVHMETLTRINATLRDLPDYVWMILWLGFATGFGFAASALGADAAGSIMFGVLGFGCAVFLSAIPFLIEVRFGRNR